jgi:hypothetical protein
MKRALLILGASILLGGGLRAQEDSFEKVQKDLNEVFRNANKSRPDPEEVSKLVDRLVDLGVDGKGEAAGFQSYQFSLQLLEYLPEEKQLPVFTEVMDALIESWLDQDDMAAVVQSLGYMPQTVSAKATEYFDWIAKDSKNETVQCAVAVTKVRKEIGTTVDVAKTKSLIAKLEALKKKYGEKAKPFGLDEEIEALKEVGKPVKEIVGPDLDGVTFKLSDYRGKVVLLDFWGYW